MEKQNDHDVNTAGLKSLTYNNNNKKAQSMLPTWARQLLSRGELWDEHLARRKSFQQDDCWLSSSMEIKAINQETSLLIWAPG